MAYEMRDFRYSEYVKFCEDKGITPVPYEQYDTHVLWKLCKDYQIPNSIWDLNGMGWCETEPGYTHRAAPETHPSLLDGHKVCRNILRRAGRPVTGA
jgi:hypothetical protein